MQDSPKNSVDLANMFPTEESCLKYLISIRWPSGYVCSKCQSASNWKQKKNRGLFYCRKCGYEASVISGTLFHGTRKPLRLWFQAIWYIANQKNGVSALGLQKNLGFGSYHTAWEWLQKLRHAMVIPHLDRLSGSVEMCQFPLIGKCRYGEEGQMLVLVAVEHSDGYIGRIRLAHITGSIKMAIKYAAIKMVGPHTSINSRGCDSYKYLLGYGYISDLDCTDGSAAPLAYRIAGLLKRWWIETHHGAISSKHLSYYLDEFAFRFSLRNNHSKGNHFRVLLERSLQTDPISVKAQNI